MRTELVHPGAENLRYEIRGIVDVAKRIQALGTPIVWENIGDPIAKGEQVPVWIKEKVQKAVAENSSFGYSPTKGLEATREYIANERNLEGGIQITAEDILFFNGLGDAISTIYDHLHPSARVIGPNPAYPTHSSAESAHADAPHITYQLNPDKGWEPDLEDLEAKIIANPSIAGILIINPDNPTGFVYSQDTIQKIVDLARKYSLFVISDEIYSNLAYEGSGMKKLASVIDGVPGIAMRGISKEFPWPGARCGWIEFYNRDKDANFRAYTESLLNAKMLEVCATTLPQAVLPEVMSDERYYPYLETRIKAYAERSKQAVEVLSEVPQLRIHPAQGAFYMTALFEEGSLTETQSLPISEEAKAIIEPYLKDAKLDQRFVYYLLAATGICVVPLSSGFNSSHNGFRFTVLESDPERYTKTLTTIQEAIRTYLAS
jgi:aspartate/methionine/tyrosine aminotransferase